MSVQASSSGTLSQKRLDGIYWKTFVGFVNRNDLKSNERNLGQGDQPKLRRREGSFEYMELTARDSVSLQSESESSCSSTDHSLPDPATKDDRATPMYAVLDMNSRKEIPINDEIAVFDGSPIKRNQDEEDSPFTDKDEVPYEDDSFDRLESTSPSMEPAPWKAHSLSIQRWMVPQILPDNEDEIVNLPDAVPMTEFEYCHYVPTLEAIMEESEEWADSREDSSRSRLLKSASYSDTADALEGCDNDGAVRWNSANDLTSCSQSVDDLFSITSTYGSLGSLRKVGTFENLSFDEEGSEEETDGSSDELDRIGTEIEPRREPLVDHSHVTERMFSYNNQDMVGGLPAELCSVEDVTEDAIEDITGLTEPPPATEFLTVPNEPSDISSDFSSPEKLESSREVIPASSTQSLLDSELQSSGRGSPTPGSSIEFLDDKATEPLQDSASKIIEDSDAVRRDSGVDDVTSEPPDESGSTSSKKDFDIQDSPTELVLPGLPDELYIDEKDIPKIVVMFAQEELEKERLAKQRALLDQENGAFEEDLVQYRKRSATYDPEAFQDVGYSTYDGVPRRINQIKASDASRLSTLSSSTPELSAMQDDELLYIPVSYASAAAKKKKKRRATMSSTEGTGKARGAALQTKALISGTGFGNGFSSLRKKLKSRRSTGGSIRRSNSEKPNLSYSSPDVSDPVSKFLHSPRHRSERKPSRQDSPPKVEGRRRGIRSVVTNIFRRLGSRFSFQSRPSTDDVAANDVIEQVSPGRSSLGVVKEESSTGESVSMYSSARGSVVMPATTDKCVGPSPRRYSCVVSGAARTDNADNFRKRSSSVPVRPLSRTPSSRYASAESDVFESMHSTTDENSLDRTIYV